MRNTFIEYNHIETDKIKKLWDNAIFIFDTNVLLNLYRYSEETLNKYMETILKLNKRVWLPYQVGLEFNKNRLTVISDQKKLYEEFEKKINDIIGEVENKNRNPFLSKNLFDNLISIKNDIKKEINSKIKGYEDSINNDLLLDKINNVFEGRIGDSYNTKELKQLYAEGEKRYANKIPPGYNDIKKPENERYGDFIIWNQIISKSKHDKMDIIFILDDRKEDWWLEHQGRTISPRPELLKEFRLETERYCHFYKPFQFLEYSNEYLGNTIKDEVIEEVKNFKSGFIEKNNYILLNISLQGELSDLEILIQEMKTAGYNVYKEIFNQSESHELYILLPNIPDLERRLNVKYLSKLDHYNLKLVSLIKK